MPVPERAVGAALVGVGRAEAETAEAGPAHEQMDILRVAVLVLVIAANAGRCKVVGIRTN